MKIKSWGRLIAQCPLVFPVARILQKLWGRPPIPLRQSWIMLETKARPPVESAKRTPIPLRQSWIMLETKARPPVESAKRTGLRGSPWTRSSQRDQSHLDGKAGQGAVRGPGVRPTIFADRPVMGKTSGIGLSACTTELQPQPHVVPLPLRLRMVLILRSAVQDE